MSTKRKRQPEPELEPEPEPLVYLDAHPPQELHGLEGRMRWIYTIGQLENEHRHLPRSNEGVLMAYCSAFQLLADCEKSLATDGLLVDGGRDGKRRSPALSGKLQALTAIRNLANELGLSPRSAKNMILPPLEEEEYNEWRDL